MLLDAKLDQLGDVLRNEKDTMVGRSVASVRSPVRNIASFQPSVTHESFCDALVQAFAARHGLEDKVVTVKESDLEGNDFIQKSNSELEVRNAPNLFQFFVLTLPHLKSWDWKYGQTLEFNYALKGEFHGQPIVRPSNMHCGQCLIFGFLSERRLRQNTV
jgi:lipoate-protein ligase A